MLSRDGMKNCGELGVDWASNTADLYQAFFHERRRVYLLAHVDDFLVLGRPQELR